MNKGIKDESYDDESKHFDLELFKSTLEERVRLLHDPRAQDNQHYELFTLLAIIFCAIVGGANSITAIHRYATAKEKWLKK